MVYLSRKAFAGFATAAGLAAMLAASSTPAAADWHGYRGGWGPRWGGPAAVGLIGGLALGAIAAGASRPVYAAPVYGPPCHAEWRPIYTPDGYYLRDGRVTVCD